ncbi:alanine racemase [Altererythrobacter litoralis]|uniref:alanine racemase n=1 Tax=Altererythrobacter litoralis TaxID=3113904 RepID=A0ABU7GBG9_9SPHN|nr:alanine racemase [Erythrobacteraceae bacterium 1XM1-14]
MAEAPPPSLRLTIDRDALAHNWRALDRLSGRASAGAAVKADCYGLGFDTCLPVLRDAGAKDFFVAHWSEVATVARHVDPRSIAVLHGPANRADADYARASGAVPVINSLHQAKQWLDSGGGPCDLMVDSGINRLGISLSEAGDLLVAQLDVRVLMSHLASSDEDSALNAWQLGAFREVLPMIAHKRASLANSAGIALGPDYHFDMTRPGLALYGGVPRGELENAIRQVAYPEAAIIQTRSIAPGDTVGYNATFTADRDMRVGVVSIGYADGILRCWGNSGALKHGEHALPILGKVSMDMVVIDLSAAPELSEGDWVQLPYRLPDAAQHTGLSQYELLTVLGRRLKSG